MKKEQKQDLIILSNQTINQFKEQENPADLIALYVFYYYTANRQETNQPWCTDSYVMKGLKIGKDRFRRAKKILLSLGLIEQIQDRNKNQNFNKCYVKLPFILKRTTITKIEKSRWSENRLPAKQEENKRAASLKSRSAAKQTINAYNDINKINKEISAKSPNLKISSFNREMINWFNRLIENKFPIEKRKTLPKRIQKRIPSRINTSINSETLIRLNELLTEILPNGTFGKTYHLGEKFKERNHISEKQLNHKFTEKEIKRNIKRLATLYYPGYWDQDKYPLPKSLLELIYKAAPPEKVNKYKTENKSYFFMVNSHPPRLPEQEKTDEEIKNKIKYRHKGVMTEEEFHNVPGIKETDEFMERLCS